MTDFSKFKIKDYKHWGVFIHQNQGYLGRCVIWCNREDALDLADANLEEREELFIILNDLRQAAKEVFQADWMNYSFLGNGTRHLHGHFIPRYASKREFAGVTFKDELWGNNYKTDNSLEFSDEVVEGIRIALSNALNQD